MTMTDSEKMIWCAAFVAEMNGPNNQLGQVTEAAYRAVKFARDVRLLSGPYVNMDPKSVAMALEVMGVPSVQHHAPQ